MNCEHGSLLGARPCEVWRTENLIPCAGTPLSEAQIAQLAVSPAVVMGVLGRLPDLPRSMFPPIIDVPYGHKHRVEAHAASCLATLMKKGRLATLCKKMGRVFAVDYDGRALPISLK